MVDLSVYIGRFEPVHNGHLALLHHALSQTGRVVVVIGSAWQARSPKNPFTWQEREAMLRGALSQADNARVQVLPMRDHYDEAVWASAVKDAVNERAGATARIGLVGHFKDASSSYLKAFPGWTLVPVERHGAIDATAIRDAAFGATAATLRTALAPLAHAMPHSTFQALEQLGSTPAYTALQEEWRMLRSYREAWAAAPYPPVFVTVDAVLRCQDQVLLIRRAHVPGKGLWAVPGGFIEQRETLWQSCLRELTEETHCDLPEATLRAALQQVTVFDHPDRSQRGRTITHAHCFDLGDTPLPAVRADDDAMQAQWTPIAQLAGMEEAFFEDHFHILDHFFDLTDRKRRPLLHRVGIVDGIGSEKTASV